MNPVSGRVTLGFISCERLHYLRSTLLSARQCIQYPDLEWLVVDDDSVEPGLRPFLDGCDWVKNRIYRRQTHAEAMNELIEQATGEYVLIWPEDVQFITSGRWLEELIALLDANPDIGCVCLDAQRMCTLQRILKPCMRDRLCRLRSEVDRFGWFGRRKSRQVVAPTGFTLWTYGNFNEGIVGSGIPSLMRTSVWRELGPWRVAKPDARIIDSSLGAEDDMIQRVRHLRLRLQMAITQVPVAADIINDEIGCKAKFRRGIRYGRYEPPSDSSGYYYRIRTFEERRRCARSDRPLSFSECVEPLGFSIPLDTSGDRLKASFNEQPAVRIRPV